MHHPFHIHGAGRFLILSRDGITEPNLVWKDTVLVPTGSGRRPPAGRHPPRPMDGALPHRRTPRERNDAQLQRRPARSEQEFDSRWERLTMQRMSDAAAGIAGLPDRRLRRPRRRHRPARREDVPAEAAPQGPYALQVHRHEFRPVRDENPDHHRQRMAHCHIASPPRERHAVRVHGRGRVWEATPSADTPHGYIAPMSHPTHLRRLRCATAARQP